MDAMKMFISSAQKYSKSFQEDDINVMESQLEVLSVCTDMSIFDPDGILATEFYCHLHRLLQIFVAAPRSKIVWNSVSVLQQASQNPVAKSALLHVHRFASVLGRLLVAGAATLLIRQKIQLLKLLQELTYDVEITWQEALTPGLIHSLVLWVCSATSADDGSRELVGPSLGVLVNLCHKNLVAFCILAHCIDTRDLLQIVTDISNCESHLSIQAFKMMRILRANDIPEVEILSFCKSSFKTALDALQNGEIFLLRQTVDFCVELFTESDSKEVIIHKYKSLKLDIQDILNQMSDGKQPRSIALCLELLAAVAAMGVEAVRAQCSDMVAVALRWIHVQTVSSSALCVLHAVVMEIWPDQDSTYSAADDKVETDNSTDKDESGSEEHTSSSTLKETILEQLETGLLVLVTMLEEINFIKMMQASDVQKCCTTLLQIFQRLINVSGKLQEQILSTMCPEHIVSLFRPLFDNSEYVEGKIVFKEEIVSLFVEALLLMSNLAPHNCLWQEAYSGMLDHIVLQRLLAMALYIAPKSVKTQVLSLVHNSYFPVKSLNILSRSLFDLESMLLQPQNVEIKPTTSFRRQQDMIFLFTPAQEKHLNDIVSRLEEALKNGQIANVEAADAVDIYQWKLAALRSSERMLCASMETAGDHITRIQQKLARATARAKQNKKLLSSSQQELQSLHAEHENTNKKLNEVQAQTHNLESVLTKEKQSKEEVIEALKNKDHELQSAELHIGVLLQKLDMVCVQLDQREAELKTIQDNLYVVNKDLETHSMQLEEKSKEYEMLQKQNEELCTKNISQQNQLDQLMDEINDKEQLLEDALDEIRLLKETVNSQDVKLKIQNGKLVSALFELKMLNDIRHQIHELSSGNAKISIDEDNTKDNYQHSA